MIETPFLVFCCCCLKSTIFAFIRAVLCFHGDMWTPNLAGKQQNGYPRTWSDEQGCPEVSPVTGQLTWLCFSLPALKSACELPRGTWVSANLQPELCTGAGCRHVCSFPFCDGGKDLASCPARFGRGSAAGAPRQMGRVKGTASLAPSCPQQSGY